MTARLSAVVLLFVGSLVAEPSPTARHIRIHVAFASGSCAVSTRVVLVGRSGPAAEGNADEQCVVNFDRVPEGRYHLHVSGQNLPDTDSGSITISGASPDGFEVRVKGASDPVRFYGSQASELVSASDLGVPARARKEFDKANELVEKQNLPRAIDRLKSAIAAYPDYATAYNNLGVVYSRLGDWGQARSALEKAIALNDHFALAYVNLGWMSVASGDFASAAKALYRAVAVNPNMGVAFVLLSYADFMSGRLDEAISASRKAHQLPGIHAYAHLVASDAYVQKQQEEDAVAELQLFLKEEPTGPRADRARRQLETLQERFSTAAGSDSE